MFSSLSQFTTGILLCGYAIAAGAVPFHVSRQAACDTNPHKIGVLWKGNIVGWLGSPKAAHPEKIGLVHDESTAHTFQLSSCQGPVPPARSVPLICTDCDPSANVIGAINVDMMAEYFGFLNSTLFSGAADGTYSGGTLTTVGWTFDGSEFIMNWSSTALAIPPFCWYDGTLKTESVSVLVEAREDFKATEGFKQNCKFVVQ